MPPQRKKAWCRRKIWEPLFFRAGGARKIFRPKFHFGPTPPLKKFGDNVWCIHHEIEEKLNCHKFRNCLYSSQMSLKDESNWIYVSFSLLWHISVGNIIAYVYLNVVAFLANVTLSCRCSLMKHFFRTFIWNCPIFNRVSFFHSYG